MRLRVDVHEPATHAQACARMLRSIGVEVSVEALACGDYVLGQQLGIERKEPLDFRKSVFDGRLFQQAQELRANFEHAILLVDGSVEDVVAPHGQSARVAAAMWGAVASLYVNHRVPVLFAGRRGTPHAVLALCRKFARERVTEYTPVRPKARHEEHAVAVLASFPRLGPELARRLLARYGSLQRALARVDRWPTDVDGIGPGIAGKTRAMLRDPYAPAPRRAVRVRVRAPPAPPAAQDTPPLTSFLEPPPAPKARGRRPGRRAASEDGA